MLPVVSEDVIESVFIKLNSARSNQHYLTEAIDIIQKENPHIYEYLIGIAHSSDELRLAPLNCEVYLRGMIKMYMLLRSQAVTDDLNEQWKG
jgi:hypothetical protein